MRPGDSFRVAVRPERVELETGVSPESAAGTGTRLAGTIAEVVYLGMYTQFHVETGAGRIVSHRLAGESAEPLQAGTPVRLTWAAEHASVLEEPAV